MTPTTARPALPEDADELLRLRVAVLDGGPLTDEWRTTFRDDMRERLGSDPNLLAYVVPTDADLIYVLHQGRLAEQGTHAQLMADPDGRYRASYLLQAAQYATALPHQRDGEPTTEPA
ncbi:hypothetical protein ACFVFS_18845 [Kitasatospora sp. NPDC057692]|uniref:hypothetical protein n=1 Tax=Kitasatospora sp. NPDC057692 TaxID=3346215 RepID=UPI00369AF412